VIDCPTIVSSKRAHRHANAEGKQNTYNANGEGNLRSVENTRKNIASELIRSAEIDRIPRVAGPKQVHARWNHPKQPIWITANEEADRLAVICDRLVFELPNDLLISRNSNPSLREDQFRG